MPQTSVRRGTRQDLPLLLEFIQELADYEKAPLEVENTLEILEADGFGEQALFGFFMADYEGQSAGMALYYYRYSTWKGKCLYLEDLYVREAFRKKAVGLALFKQIMEQAIKDDCKRISWQVLDWNTPAIGFYEKLGASFDQGWINCALTKAQTLEALKNLG